ncbi:O-antigen polymerase [Alistipes sp. ZOR0009]|uniref:O-antigen polymerase n=1 Tax=Alistipes sp. ZOR0009 TaxID=1339253 RepID=UPI000646C2B4|nr:O-antigen polymerase [Alistipes sp. ZOR0009]
MSLLLLFFALLFFAFYYYYTRDVLNPCSSFLFIWYLTSSISSIDYNDFMAPWSSEMFLVVIVSGISFWIGSLFFLNKVSTKCLTISEVSSTYTIIIRLLFVICFGTTIVEWLNGGGQISLFVSNINGDVKSQMDGDIPGIHYGTIFFPYIAVLTYFRYINSEKKQFLDLLIILIVVSTSLLFKMSRGDMMIYIFSFLFIYTRYYKINFRKIIFILAIFITVVVGGMLLRVSSGSIVMNTTSNPYFSIFYSYIATCYANLNDFINQNNSYHFLGNATFAPFWTLIGMKEHFQVVSTTQLNMFNAVPYVYGFYHDYKYLGIVFFPFTLGVVISVFYFNASFGRNYWILMIAVLQKAIFNSFFGNYFSGELVNLFPYIVIFFLVLFVMNYRFVVPVVEFKINNKKNNFNGNYTTNIN